MKFYNFLFSAAIILSAQTLKAEEVPPPTDAVIPVAQEKSIFETRSFEDVEKLLQANGAYVAELSADSPGLRSPSGEVH